MTKYEIMNNLIENKNGYLLTSDVIESGISKPYMLDFVKKRNLERVAQGVYMSEDAWLDELYIISLRNKEAVLSHETALYLHGLMEREPTAIMLTVSRVYNATHLRNKGYVINFECTKCGEKHNNKSALDDNFETILSVMNKTYNKKA